MRKVIHKEVTARGKFDFFWTLYFRGIVYKFLLSTIALQLKNLIDMTIENRAFNDLFHLEK